MKYPITKKIILMRMKCFSSTKRTMRVPGNPSRVFVFNMEVLELGLQGADVVSDDPDCDLQAVTFLTTAGRH